VEIMTILRSQSIISASMDDIDAIPDGCTLFSSSRTLHIDDDNKERNTKPITQHDIDQSSSRTSSSPSPSPPTILPTPIPTKDPRKFDKTTEEEGYRQIIEALTPQEIQNMSDPNLPLRHFRADKGNIKKAIKRIKYAIQWRTQNKVDQMLQAAHHPITPEDHRTRQMLMTESQTGKMYVRGYDKDGRAVMYLTQQLENTYNEANNIRNLIYNIERMIACSHKRNYDKSVLVFDFLGWKMKHASSMALTKMTIHIVQECYVERIDRIYFSNAPSVFRTFFNMVKVFLDPNTKNKIVFVNPEKNADAAKVAERFDLETCERCLSGKVGHLKEYNVEDYFSVPLNVSFDEEQQTGQSQIR
jgi:hypothetical protein